MDSNAYQSEGEGWELRSLHALWKDPPPDHQFDKPTPILPLDPAYGPNIVYA